MDALPVAELNEFPIDPASGHHARLWSRRSYRDAPRCGPPPRRAGNFDGTVVFIFQPAEAEGGAAVMIADGLFKRFPVESVYGLHNWPGYPWARWR